MNNIKDLIRGYENFFNENYQKQIDLYTELAKGQSPKIMVISCCDSRVDPVTVFNASPGDLFVLRTIASMVPEYNSTKECLGVASAVEFAVRVLNVNSILVVGHSNCGGARALLDGVHNDPGENVFFPKWISSFESISNELLQNTEVVEPEVKNNLCEQAIVKLSMKNLCSFPFIQERIRDASLSIYGAHFNINNGQLLILKEPDGKFELITI